MAWDFINKIFAIKPVEKPDFEKQKLIWSDAAKIEAKVHDIIAVTLNLDLERIKSDTAWALIIIDSVGGEEAFMMCEEVFGIDIPDTNPDGKAGEWTTVGQLTTYIQRAFGVGA